VPSLGKLQRWLRWIITDPRGVNGALSDERFELGTGRPDPEPLPRQLATVTSTGSASAAERLSVYASGYFWRLFEALASDFPAAHHALGPAAFQEFVAEYLVRHPSESPNLADLGGAVPSFSFGCAATQDFPFLPDLTLLEWNVHLSLLSPREPYAPPASMPESDWSSLRVRFDPTVRLVITEWSVAGFWKAVRANRPPPTPPRRRRQWLVVHRDDVWVRVRAVDRAQWCALLSLQQGCPLGWVCERLADELPQQAGPSIVDQWFGAWVKRGLVSRIETGASLMTNAML